MDQQEEFSDICADLVSLKKHGRCIEKLLSSQQGSWQRLTVLCAGDTELRQRLAALGSEAESVHATWLPFEQSVYGAGYVTVIFFSELLHWHSVALFNTSTLPSS